MRSREEVLERFRELRDKNLRQRKSRFLSSDFVNCAHNVRLPVKGVGKVGLCQNPVLLEKRGQKPLVCNGSEFSNRCECFKHIHTERLIEHEFEAILSSPSRCGEEYPKLAMLIWFLQDDSRHSETRTWRLLGHVRRAFSELFKVVTFRWLF
jgi:hypothetical protein